MSDSIWRRGGSGPGGERPTARGRGVGGPRGRDAPIQPGGFRRAMGEVGRKPSEMEMLQSPSRGIDDEAASLRNPEVQAKFRAHIASKLVKFHSTFPDSTPDGRRIPSSAKRQEELSIILLDFRKLREGLTSSRRVDAFAAEVYEYSVRYAISAENWAQLGACLPTLVFELHPSLCRPSPPPSPDPSSLSNALSSLSLSPFSPSHVAFYQSLHLLHLLLHHSSLPSFHSTLASFSPATPLPPHLILATRIFRALLQNNFLDLSRILSSSSTSETEPRELQLAILRGAIPRLRELGWEAIARSYKDFRDTAWLGRVLLFDAEDQQGVEAFLREKGVVPGKS